MPLLLLEQDLIIQSVDWAYKVMGRLSPGDLSIIIADQYQNISSVSIAMEPKTAHFSEVDLITQSMH